MVTLNFIIKHAQTRIENIISSLCPLKKIKFSLNMFKNRVDSVAKTDKRHALVYDTMSRLYNLGFII